MPKSTQGLRPGDFWAIPLQGDSFACGRVIELPPKGMVGARVAFLGGLLQWKGDREPTYESIAAAPVIRQGVMHILAITTTGGFILGQRPLELDSIEPWVFVDGNTVKRGFTPLRAWRREDTAELPSLSTWGYDVIRVFAEKYLSA